MSDWRVGRSTGTDNGLGYYAQLQVFGFLSDGRIAYYDDWNGLQTVDPTTGEVEEHPKGHMRTQRYADRLLGDALVGQPHEDSLATYDFLTKQRRYVPIPPSFGALIYPAVVGPYVGYTGYDANAGFRVVELGTGETVWDGLPNAVPIIPDGFGPDASRLAYFAGTYATQIHIDTRSERDFGYASGAWVSPDGRWVVLGKGTYHDNHLMSAAADGSSLYEYDPIFAAGGGRQPFAPDGSVFAAAFNYRIRGGEDRLERRDDSRDGLYEIDPSTGQVRQIIESEYLKLHLTPPSEEYISVSPLLYSKNGQTLYFSVERQQHFCSS